MIYYGTSSKIDPVLLLDNKEYSVIIILNDYPTNAPNNLIIVNGIIKSVYQSAPKYYNIVCKRGVRTWDRTEFAYDGTPFKAIKHSLCGGNICSSPEPMHVPLSDNNEEAVSGQMTSKKAQVGDSLLWDYKKYLITETKSFAEKPLYIDFGETVPPDVPEGFSSGNCKGNYYDTVTIYDEHDTFFGKPNDTFEVQRTAWADSRQSSILEYSNKLDGIFHVIPSDKYLFDKVSGWIIIEKEYANSNLSEGIFCFRVSSPKMRRYNSVHSKYINQLESMIQVCNTCQISQTITNSGGMYAGAQLTANGGTSHYNGRWSGYVWGRKKGEIERNSLYAWSDGWSGGTRAYKPVSYFGDMRTGGIIYPEVFFGTTGNTPLFFNYDFSGTIKLSKDNYIHGDSAYGGTVGGGIIVYNSDGTDPRDEGVPGEIETFHRDEYSGSKNFVGIRPYNLGLSYEALKIQVECNFVAIPFSFGGILKRIPTDSTILNAWLEYDFDGVEHINVMTRINPDPTKLYTEVSYDMGTSWTQGGTPPAWEAGVDQSITFGLYARRRDSRTQDIGNTPIHVPNGHIFTFIGKAEGSMGTSDKHGVMDVTEAIQSMLSSKDGMYADYFWMPSQGGDLLAGGGGYNDFVKSLIPPCSVTDGVDGNGNPVPIASWGPGAAIKYDNLTIISVIIKYQLKDKTIQEICYPLTGNCLK